MKLLRYIFFNLGLYGLTYLAIFQNATWAGRIIFFYAAFHAAMMVIIAASDDIKAKVKAEPRTVPLWMDTAIDIGLVAAFVGAGWYGTAILFLWALACNYSIRETPTKAEKETQLASQAAEQRLANGESVEVIYQDFINSGGLFGNRDGEKPKR